MTWAWSQESLFEPDEHEQALNLAVEKVEHHPTQPWFDYAMQAVKLIATNREEFTTDPVWAVLERWRWTDEIDQTNETRAMGAVMRKAAQLGWCEATNRTEKSKRPACHGRPVRIWKSSIFASDCEVPHGYNVGDA